MRKMRNWAQLVFVARKMRKFAPIRKPVALLETLILTKVVKINDPKQRIYMYNIE